MSEITHFTVTLFAARDEAYCNLDDIFLVSFAISFFDTRIWMRKHGNIPTSKPLSSPSLTQRARQTPPAALLIQLKCEAQIKRRCRRPGDVDAVHNGLLRNRFQRFIAKQTVWSSAQKFCARWTWSNFAHAPASCASILVDVMAWPNDSMQLKLDQYVARPPTRRASCPTCWWVEHKTSYQIFTVRANNICQQFVSKPATSSRAKEICWRHQKPTLWFFLWTMWLLRRC